MLVLNFHGGPFIILSLSVFIQVSISDKYNFQCVNFREHDTLTFKIIFKGIPKEIKNSPTLKYLNMKDGNITNFYGQITSRSATYKEYDNVNLVNPSNGSLLYVKFFYYVDESIVFKRVPLKRFILQKNDSGSCSDHCVIEFDDWDVGDKTHKITNHPQLLDGPQKINYTSGDKVIIEAVNLYNIPTEVHHVGLILSNNNAPVECEGNGEVTNRSYVFKKFNFTLFPSYGSFKVLLRLNSSKNNKDESLHKELLHFNLKSNIATKHPCLDKCTIVYDLEPFKKILSDLDASAVCPNVLSISNQNTTSVTTEGTKTSTRLTEVKADAGTTTTTVAKTTITTDGKTVKTNDQTLAIVLSTIAVVLFILILGGIYWYRRHKAPKPENDDTYFYATQLNYAQLELESSDLYEAPKKDYVSVYTRIIGVLKPKSSA